MRCLQCGKDLPLLKRLAGGEFCSVAHRREYQQEYSQLALGRLLQSKPSELEKDPTEVERGAAVPDPAAVKNKQSATAAVNGAAPAVANPGPVVVRAETAKKVE